MAELRIVGSDQILEAVALARRRADVVPAYRAALRYVLQLNRPDLVDWRAVNTAIAERWSWSAVKWIKREAWRSVLREDVVEAVAAAIREVDPR